MRGASARRTLGFSLIELAVSIGIVGIIAAISIPAYSRHRSNMQLRSNVEQLSAALRQAHAGAMQFADNALPDQTQIGSLPSAPGRFTVYTVKAGVPSASVSGDTTNVVLTSVVNVGPPQTPVGAAITVKDNATNTLKLYFRQDGGLYDPSNGLPAKQNQTIVFDNGNIHATITLTPQGTVTVTESPSQH